MPKDAKLKSNCTDSNSEKHNTTLNPGPARGYQVESIDGQVNLLLANLIEGDKIPDNRSDIPTLKVPPHYPHLKVSSTSDPRT